MRVRITQAFASAKGSHNPGEELDVPDARGMELLRMGVAERIESKPETTTLPKRGEQAVRARPVR